MPSSPRLTPYWTVPFPDSALSSQLKMVARLIEAGNRSVASQGFGMKRQIFFCQIGGYDLHSSQTDGRGRRPPGRTPTFWRN